MWMFEANNGIEMKTVVRLVTVIDDLFYIKYEVLSGK